MRVETGYRASLQELADLMNICCSQKRGFSKVTAHQLANVWSRGEGLESAGLMLVKSDGVTVGASHGFYEPHDRTGFIAFIIAMPGLEDQVWPLLLSAVEYHLSKAQVIHVGSPHTPLYQAAEGRFRPLWGSTEVLEVDALDEHMLLFLELHGYKRQHEYVTMTRFLKDLALPESMSCVGKVDRLSGDECWYNAYSWYGRSSSEEFGQRRAELRVIALLKGHKVLGHVAWYPLDGSRAAICDLEITRSMRGQGLGKNMLLLALREIKATGFHSVELHTSAQLSPVGFGLYQKLGFSVETTWIELAKRLRA